MGKTQRNDRRLPRGMTLIELLVVATLMLILVLISIPVVKPMLDSSKQQTAADTLSSFLTQAKLRAMETGRPCGVRFERYTALNQQQGTIFPYNNACLVLRQVETPPPYTGSSGNALVTVDVSTGEITLDVSEEPFWNQFVQVGDSIQFDNQGPYYEIKYARSNLSSTLLPEVETQDPMKPPLKTYGDPSNPSPVPFKVLRSPQPTLAAPVGFPTGIVVDLRYSGREEQEYFFIGSTTFLGDSFAAQVSDDRKPVTVMFSPSGEMTKVLPQIGSPLNLLYFLIGKWERSGLDYNTTPPTGYLPDDKLYNYDDVSNFWVKIEPSSGRVSTFKVAPVWDTTTNTSLSSRQDKLTNDIETEAWGWLYQDTRRYGK